jgi:hypothetical protein
MCYFSGKQRNLIRAVTCHLVEPKHDQMNTKIVVVFFIILTIILAGLYYLETERTKNLKSVIEQRNRAFVTLNSVTMGLINLSNISTDSLLSEISVSTQILTNSATSYVIGTTLENPEHYTWDFDEIEIIVTAL